MTNTKAEKAVKDLIEALQLEKLDDIESTPRRVVEYLQEFNQPLQLQKIFGGIFPNKSIRESFIMQRDIPFRMICSHHLLPAMGHVSFGYIPGEKIIGLSKIARLVQGVGTEAPTLQEEAGDRIISVFNTYMRPKCTVAIISAEHTCMSCRGVNKSGVRTITEHNLGAGTLTLQTFYSLNNIKL